MNQQQTKKPFLDLYNEFRRLAQEGNEEKVRRFLMDHLKEFPENIQEDIIFAFFEEGLERSAEEEEVVGNVREGVIEAGKTVEKLQGILDNRVKMEEIRKKLDK